MKYWLFQNNQVLGPYAADDLAKMPIFSAESLVCPEGRRGTTMGDWQRAGMVPDLSLALVRSTDIEGKSVSVAVAGLPPEPTLRDLAVLGSLQEKVTMLESVVLQLQEGLRAKDAELATLNGMLAEKGSESESVKKESESAKNEAAEFRRESQSLRKDLTALEERLSSVRLLSEALDKALEEEKRVGQDVEKQGQTLMELSREVESLRRELDEKMRRAEEAAAAQPPAPSFALPAESLASAAPAFPDTPAPAAAPAFADTPAPAAALAPTFPAPTPAPAPTQPPAPPPRRSLASPAAIEPELIDLGEVTALPTDGPALPPLNAPALLPTEIPAVPFPGSAHGFPAAGGFDPLFGSTPILSPDPAAAFPGASEQALNAAPVKSRKPLLLTIIAGAALIGGYAAMENAPQAPPIAVSPELPAPAPPPEPAVDLRQTALALAKGWTLPGGKTLAATLDQLAPQGGNLSPWMGELLPGGRVQVNYFTRGSVPGAPTIAYEFEADPGAGTLVGRNAAASAILKGAAPTAPAPPKPKPVTVKPKRPAAAPKPAPPAEDDSLDSLVGDPAPAKRSGVPTPAPAAPEPEAAPAGDPPAVLPADSALAEPGAGDGSDLRDPIAPAAAPKRAARAPRRGKRATEAAPKKGQDEALLDDLLKEFSP